MQKIEFMGVGAESVMITGPIFFCGRIVQADNDIKRSSPLISAGVLSSEGLCSSHLALLRQLTSALFPTAPARLCEWDSHRLARSAAQMAHAQRHSFRTSRFIPRTLMKSGQAL